MLIKTWNMADPNIETLVKNKITGEPLVKIEVIDPFLEVEESEPSEKRKKIESCIKVEEREPLVFKEEIEPFIQGIDRELPSHGDTTELFTGVEKVEQKLKVHDKEEEDDKSNMIIKDEVILGAYVEVEETTEIFLKAEHEMLPACETDKEIFARTSVKLQGIQSEEGTEQFRNKTNSTKQIISETGFSYKRKQAQHTGVNDVSPQFETPKLAKLACGDCGKEFLHKYALNRHSLVHTGIKKFPCPECSKQFARKTDLVRHSTTHLPSKFECECCGKAFKTEHEVVRHIMVHVAVQDFACPECGRKFAKKDQLDQHRVLHTRGDKFICPRCGRWFTRKYTLATHLAKVSCVKK